MTRSNSLIRSRLLNYLRISTTISFDGNKFSSVFGWQRWGASHAAGGFIAQTCCYGCFDARAKRKKETDPNTSRLGACPSAELRSDTTTSALEELIMARHRCSRRSFTSVQHCLQISRCFIAAVPSDLFSAALSEVSSLGTILC